MAGIGTGIGSTGLSGAAEGLGGSAASGFPWMMAADMGIGLLGAAIQPKFKLQDNSTIEDVKAHAAQRAGQIPMLGKLLAPLAAKITERKWQPVFDNRQIKQEQISDLGKETDKMNMLLNQRRQQIQDTNMFAKSDIGENWKMNY